MLASRLLLDDGHPCLRRAGPAGPRRGAGLRRVGRGRLRHLELLTEDGGGGGTRAAAKAGVAVTARASAGKKMPVDKADMATCNTGSKLREHL